MSSSFGVIMPVIASKPVGVIRYMSSTWKPMRPGIMYSGSIVQVILGSSTTVRVSVM